MPAEIAPVPCRACVVRVEGAQAVRTSGRRMKLLPLGSQRGGSYNRATTEAHVESRAMSGVIRAGTSGFSFPEWNGNFYPEKLAQKDMLRYYAERFGTVEIN